LERHHQVITRLGDPQLMVVQEGYSAFGEDGEDGWQSCEESANEDDEGIYASVSMPHLVEWDDKEKDDKEKTGSPTTDTINNDRHTNDAKKGSSWKERSGRSERSFPDFASAIAANTPSAKDEMKGRIEVQDGGSSNGSLRLSSESDGGVAAAAVDTARGNVQAGEFDLESSIERGSLGVRIPRIAKPGSGSSVLDITKPASSTLT
jgi:hypothetical protein